jgi:hypothetical protein
LVGDAGIDRNYEQNDVVVFVLVIDVGIASIVGVNLNWISNLGVDKNPYLLGYVRWYLLGWVVVVIVMIVDIVIVIVINIDIDFINLLSSTSLWYDDGVVMKPSLTLWLFAACDITLPLPASSMFLRTFTIAVADKEKDTTRFRLVFNLLHAANYSNSASTANSVPLLYTTLVEIILCHFGYSTIFIITSL